VAKDKYKKIVMRFYICKILFFIKRRATFFSHFLIFSVKLIFNFLGSIPGFSEK